ncbi:hypothetical protein GIB67_000391 [Kingdonia uniflora]|uniref:Uncharacterized protein n=1 Tax=Kingdonia uniflora TaxID=39325 RepID=A0A7J7KVC3_9MAGN|nr:hypothetical protein GIB67_000391 [Kingdonia uniflora]
MNSSSKDNYGLGVGGLAALRDTRACGGNLSELRVLSIPHNAFYGNVPVEIGKLQFLEILELQGNNFSGWIPDQIGNFKSLQVLNLSYNFLSGKIPRELIGFGRIRVIDLSYNKLNGGVNVDHGSEIPVEIGRISELRVLDVSRNSLTDRIPKELAKCRNLSYLVLTNLVDGEFNAFVGGILKKYCCSQIWRFYGLRELTLVALAGYVE